MMCRGTIFSHEKFSYNEIFCSFKSTKNDKLATLTQHYKPWDDKMKDHIKSTDTVPELNRNINVSLVTVLIETLDYPDKSLPLQLLSGLPICDNITYDRGVYRKVESEENEKDYKKLFN